MSQRPAYTPYHPRWHRTRVSTYWWLERPSYVLFILRELSSLFVAWFVVYLFMLIDAVSRNEVAYRQFLEWSHHPFVLLLNIVSLFFVVFHAVTWFSLAPKAMVAHVGARRLPGWWILAANYAGWVAVSTVIVGLLLGR